MSLGMVKVDGYLSNVGLTTATKGSGKKFERKKVRIAEKVKLFSSRTFFLQIFFCSYGSRGATINNDRPLILKFVLNDEE